MKTKTTVAMRTSKVFTQNPDDGISKWPVPITVVSIFAIVLLGGVPAPATSLVWDGSGAAPSWDMVTTNWLNAGLPSIYVDGDDVLFDDSAGFFSPNLVMTVQPNSVTVNATNNYIFAGSGGITGATALTKEGNGTLLINNANSFTGGVAVNGGILQVGNVNALGEVSGAVSIVGGTLDIHGIHALPYLNYEIQGTGYTNSGCIQNFSSTSSQNNNGIASLIMTGDATIGATGARWDLWGLNVMGSPGLRANGHNLTKVGPQQIWITDGGTNTQLADINILSGTLGFQSQPGMPGTDLGDPAKTLTVFPGASFGTYALPPTLLMDKNIVFNNAFFNNSHGMVTFTGPVTLLGTNIENNGYKESPGDQVNFNGPVGGSGAWVKNSVGVDWFNAANTFTGATIINSGYVYLGTNGSLASSTIQIADGGTLDASAALKGLTLNAGQTLEGGSSSGSQWATVVGEVTNGPGATLSAGRDGPGWLVAANDLALSGGTNVVHLGSNPSDMTGVANSFVQVLGNLSLSGVNTFQIVPDAILDTNSPYMVFQYGSLSGGPANVRIACTNPHYEFNLLDPSATAPYLEIQVTGFPAPLLWMGGAPTGPNIWDIGTSNWLNTASGLPDQFYDADPVIFDDTATTNVINVNQTVRSGSIIFSNANLNYTLVGAGSIAGSLAQEGAGTVRLALSNAPALNFITADAGTLVFDPQTTNDYTVSAVIGDNGNGLGTIIKADAHTMTLTGNNLNYSGAFVVTNGVLQYNNYAALGQAFAMLYVTNNGTLNLNRVNAGLKTIAIAGAGYNGQGALNDTSTSSSAYTAIANLTLVGNATIGANGRWDFPSSGTADNGGSLNGNGYDLTKIGPGQATITPSGDVNLGNIKVLQGTLLFGPHVTSLGDPTKTITVESNATLYFYGTPAVVNKHLVLNSGNLFAGLTSTEPRPQIGGPVILNGTNTIYAGTSTGLTLWGPVGGTGGFIKTGSYDLLLNGTNTYSGPTIINNGSVVVGTNSSLGLSALTQVNSGCKLDVSQPGTFSFGAGQMLIGRGTVVGGNIIFSSGSTLAPGLQGVATYALTMNGRLTLQAGSASVFKFNKTSSLANDKVSGLNAVTFGGTLVLTNVGMVALADGDAISLFSATNYSGKFDAIVPATPGDGLVWDTSSLTTDGTLKVVSTAAPHPTIASIGLNGTALTIMVTNGPAGGVWALLQSADVALPVSEWETNRIVTFDESGNLFTNILNVATNDREFYILKQ